MKDNRFAFQKLISAIYPNKCKCCGLIIEDERHLCDLCESKIEKNNLNNICLLCGFEKNDCVCKYNVYRFDALVCIYKNTGLAQNMYYKYKFGKKQYYVNYFANEMYNAVNECYLNINFDYICSVPTYRKFGYNHSGYLAKKLATLLKVPYFSNLLSCADKRKKQHDSTMQERLNNTDGKYKFNHQITDATVLLVDDIKTTGATIDECAKMLLYAGAKSVYCITMLGTINKN